jgi:membrane-associated phospholipid phosphatase
MSGEPACKIARTFGSELKEDALTQPAYSSPEQLIPPRLRPAAVVVVGICALTVILIGVLVAHHRLPTGLDSAFWNLLPWPWGPAGEHGAGFFFLTAMDQIRQLGGELAITFMTALLCYCCLAMRRYRAAILVAGGEIAASVLTSVMKPVVGRRLGGSLSYPSGHTTAAFALGTAVVVLLLVSSRETRLPRSMRIVLSLVTLATASLVALGMIAWHQHYLTDTFGGAAIGIGVPLTVALLTDFVADRRGRVPARRRVPDAEPVTAITGKS